MLSSIMQITQTKDGMCVLNEDEVDRERIESDGAQMYAIGAEVMLTYNM